MNILDIIQKLGIKIYQKSGKEVRAYCPLCHSPKIKFYCDLRTGRWICFNCNRSGSIVALIRAVTGDKDSAKQLVKKYKQYDPEVHQAETKSDNLLDQLMYIDSDDSNNDTDSASTNLKMPAKPTNCHYLLDNFNNPEAYPYFNYAHSRGLTLNDIKTHHVSYVVNGTFIKRNKQKANLMSSLIFFTYKNNTPIYWNSRIIYDGIQPKTINAPALQGQYSRRNIVFNLNNLKHGQDLCVLEGVFNALTVNHLSSNLCGVCCLGKQWGDTQIKDIASKRDTFKNLYLYLDDDAQNMYYQYVKRFEGMGVSSSRIYLIYTPKKWTGKDANDLRSKNKVLFDKAVHPSMYDELLNM